MYLLICLPVFCFGATGIEPSRRSRDRTSTELRDRSCFLMVSIFQMVLLSITCRSSSAGEMQVRKVEPLSNIRLKPIKSRMMMGLIGVNAQVFMITVMQHRWCNIGIRPRNFISDKPE